MRRGMGRGGWGGGWVRGREKGGGEGRGGEGKVGEGRGGGRRGALVDGRGFAFAAAFCLRLQVRPLLSLGKQRRAT